MPCPPQARMDSFRGQRPPRPTQCAWCHRKGPACLAGKVGVRPDPHTNWARTPTTGNQDVLQECGAPQRSVRSRLLFCVCVFGGRETHGEGEGQRGERILRFGFTLRLQTLPGELLRPFSFSSVPSPSGQFSSPGWSPRGEFSPPGKRQGGLPRPWAAMFLMGRPPYGGAHPGPSLPACP